MKKHKTNNQRNEMEQSRLIDTDKIISDGINIIKAGMRTVPDPELWKLIDQNLQNAHKGELGSDKSSHSGWQKPIVKLVTSITAAAAAIVIGIMFANLYYPGNSVNEKDVYKQEIYAESSDFTGMNDKVLDYYYAE